MATKTINMKTWSHLVYAITEKLQYFGKPEKDSRIAKLNQMTLELAKKIKKNFLNKDVVVTEGEIGEFGGTEGYDYYKLKDITVKPFRFNKSRFVPGYDYNDEYDTEPTDDFYDDSERPPTKEETKKCIEQLNSIKNIILSTSQGRVACIPEGDFDENSLVVSRISLDTGFEEE